MQWSRFSVISALTVFYFCTVYTFVFLPHTRWRLKRNTRLDQVRPSTSHCSLWTNILKQCYSTAGPRRPVLGPDINYTGPREA